MAAPHGNRSDEALFWVGLVLGFAFLIFLVTSIFVGGAKSPGNTIVLMFLVGLDLLLLWTWRNQQS